MKHKVITTEQGKVVVDETAEIYENDFHLHFYDGNSIISQSYNGGVKVVNFEKGYSKILYTINFSLDKDIPMVVVEDEVERLADINGYHDQPSHDLYKEGFLDGYKLLQQKGVYSEEDLINLVAFICNKEDENDITISESGEMPSLIVKQFIQSLNQEYIELEMEEYAVGNYGMSDGEPTIDSRVRTNRVDGQLMAYVKQ